jgi:flavin reductase (DIM6/NTAB) family NADH-FMN oxidoreductase RutF
MKKNFGAKDWHWLYPMPVLLIASYNEDGTADVMNAARGSINDDKQIEIYISPIHRTVKNILKKRAFSVSIGTSDFVRECDYVGIVSGNDEPKKIEKSGFHIEKSEFVDAPVIRELPYVLECSLVRYDEQSFRLRGQIVNVGIEENAVTSDGRINLRKINPITYDPINREYVTFGESVGPAFKIGAVLR